MANLNGIAGDIIGQTVTGMLNRFDPIATQLEQYRQLLRFLKSGEYKLEQIQLTETGGFDILPPPTPAPVAEVPVSTANGAKEQAKDKEPVEAKS